MLSSTSANGKFELLSQDVIFERYQTVKKREAQYPDGRVISFDVLGNEQSDFRSVFTFPFDRKTSTGTFMLLPLFGVVLFGLVFDPDFGCCILCALRRSNRSRCTMSHTMLWISVGGAETGYDKSGAQN